MPILDKEMNSGGSSEAGSEDQMLGDEPESKDETRPETFTSDKGMHGGGSGEAGFEDQMLGDEPESKDETRPETFTLDKEMHGGGSGEAGFKDQMLCGEPESKDETRPEMSTSDKERHGSSTPKIQEKSGSPMKDSKFGFSRSQSTFVPGADSYKLDEAVDLTRDLEGSQNATADSRNPETSDPTKDQFGFQVSASEEIDAEEELQ